MNISHGVDGYLAQGGVASDEEMAAYIATFLSHSFWKPDTSAVGGATYEKFTPCAQ